MLLEDPRRHDELSMPSWVPDFSKTSHCRLYGFNGFYDSCHRIPVEAYELSIDGSSLEVNAIVSGGVDFLGRLYEPMSIESSEIRHAFFLRDAESLDRGSSTGLTGLINSLKSYLDLRSDIDEVLRGNSELQLPRDRGNDRDATSS
jgi:hypothetical protein